MWSGSSRAPGHGQHEARALALGHGVERAPPLARARSEAAELRRAGIVERVVQHERPLARQLGDPIAEEGVEVVERAEMVVVIELGVEHDRGLRPQARQRAVRLVGLGYHEPSPADAGVGAELRHVAADQERRLLAALGEHVRDQRGRAGLAVSPRDADAVARRHDVGQDVGAVAHPQAPAARSYELGLVLGDGARDDHLHVAVQVRRIVAHAHVDAR